LSLPACRHVTPVRGAGPARHTPFLQHVIIAPLFALPCLVAGSLHCACTFRGLGLLECYDLELTFDTMNPRRTPWMGVRTIGRPLSTQDSTTQKMRPYIHVSSGIRTHELSGQVVYDHTRLRPHGHRVQHP
jgi:hypothetical protein